MEHDKNDKEGYMKRYLQVLALGTTLVLAFGVTSALAEGEGGSDAKDLWAKNCAACHGVDGKADTKVGKLKKVEDLTNPEVRAKFDRARMITATKEGVKDEAGKVAMKGYADKLSDAQIESLVDYIINDLK